MSDAQIFSKRASVIHFILSNLVNQLGWSRHRQILAFSCLSLKPFEAWLNGRLLLGAVSQRDFVIYENLVLRTILPIWGCSPNVAHLEIGVYFVSSGRLYVHGGIGRFVEKRSWCWGPVHWLTKNTPSLRYKRWFAQISDVFWRCRRFFILFFRPTWHNCFFLFQCGGELILFLLLYGGSSISCGNFLYRWLAFRGWLLPRNSLRSNRSRDSRCATRGARNLVFNWALPRGYPIDSFLLVCLWYKRWLFYRLASQYLLWAS